MAEREPREGGLIAWQWGLYPAGHASRTNLLIHILTVPIFEAGTLVLLGSMGFGFVWAIAGLAMMVGAMAAQGRGHAQESVAPVPFRGPADVLARIMTEQWIAFPRFVLTGGFARAWKNAPRG